MLAGWIAPMALLVALASDRAPDTPPTSLATPSSAGAEAQLTPPPSATPALSAELAAAPQVPTGASGPLAVTAPGYASSGASAPAASASAGNLKVVAVDGFDVAAGSSAARGAFPIGASESVRVTASGIEGDTAVPSVQIDLVERRGTNEWRAAASGGWTGGALTASRNASADVPAAQRTAGEPLVGNALVSASEAALDGGGPIVAHRAWLWANIGRAENRWTVFGGGSTWDALTRQAGKLNVEVSGANSLSVLWNRGQQSSTGLGAGPERSAETTLDRYADATVWKLEDTQVIGPTAFWSARLGSAASRLADDPAATAELIAIDPAGVAHGSWFGDGDDRRLSSADGETGLLIASPKLTNDLRLGGEARQERETARVTPPGLGVVIASGSTYELPENATVIDAYRAGEVASRLDRFGLWSQDQLTQGRATLSLGLRLDHADLRPEASRIPGSPYAPILPAVDFTGHGAGSAAVSWTTLSPRLGSTWSAGKRQQVVLRASLARFGAMLDPGLAARLTPTAPASAYSAFYALGVPPPPPPGGSLFWVPSGFDPQQPGINPNRVDPQLRAPLSDEAAASLQVVPRADLVLSLSGSYRRLSRILEDRLLVRDATGTVRIATAGDWVREGAIPGVEAAPVYDLRPGLSPTGGTLLVNGDREQRLGTLTLAAHRPLHDGWLLRGHLTFESWSWRVGPAYTHFADPTLTLGEGQRTGELVAEPAAGFGDVPLYLLARWSAGANTLVELPWSTSLAFSIEGREGYPVPYFAEVARTSAAPVAVLVNGDINRSRYDRLLLANARLERETPLARDLTATAFLEALNLFDAATVVGREADLALTRAGFVNEMIAPRIFRLGLRLAFR